MINSLLKEGFLYAFSDSIRKLSPFLLLPVYISALSLSEFGRLEYITVISALASYIIGWGSIQGLLRYYEKKGKYAVSSSMLIIVVIYFLVFLLFNSFDYFFSLSQFLDLEIKVLNACLFYGFVLSINNLSFTILRYEQRLVEYALINILFVILQIFFIFYFLIFLDLGFLSKVIGLIASNLILLPFLFFYILRSKIILSVSYKTLKEVFYFYTPIAFSNFLGWGSASVDKIAIKAFLGDEQLGIYSFVFQLAQIFKLGIESFLKSLNVFLYKNLNKIKSFLSARHLLLIIFQILAIIYLLLIFIFHNNGLFSEYPVPVLLFSLLILSRVTLLANFIEVIFFYAKTDSKTVTYSNLISFIFLAIIIAPSVLNFGLIGASFSLLLYGLSNYIILNFMQEKNLKRLFLNTIFIIFPWICLFLICCV